MMLTATFPGLRRPLDPLGSPVYPLYVGFVAHLPIKVIRKNPFGIKKAERHNYYSVSVGPAVKHLI